MEQIVRPFQLLDPTAKVNIPVVRAKVAVAPAHLCWGVAGNLPKPVQQDDTFNGVNFRVTECDNHLAEKKRQTENVRVEQPGKPQNYVIVQRIRSIDFDANNKDGFVDEFDASLRDFKLPDFFAGSSFSNSPHQDKCNHKYYYNR